MQWKLLLINRDRVIFNCSDKKTNKNFISDVLFLLYTLYKIFMNIKNIPTGFFSWSPLLICLDVNLVSVALKLVHWPRVNRSSCGEEVETLWTLKSLHDLIDLTTDGSPSVSLQQAEWFVLLRFLFNCC